MAINLSFEPNQKPVDIISNFIKTTCASPDFFNPPLGKMIINHLQAEETIIYAYIQKHQNKYDLDILLLAVWLHDSGTAIPIKGVEDHAIAGETHARDILSQLGLHADKIERVCHICRTHRNKPDNPPQTLEAKLFSAIDSASHFVGKIHEDIFMNGEIRQPIPVRIQTKRQKAQFAHAKLDRDWRDMAGFPDLQATYQAEYFRLKQLFTANL